MRITDVRLQITKDHMKRGPGCVLAQAKIVIDDCFCVTGLRIVEKENGELMVAMPSERVKPEYTNCKHKFRDIAHPTNEKTRAYITKEVLKLYHGTVEVP